VPKVGRQRSKKRGRLEESVFFLLISGGAVPEWEDGNQFWTETGQKRRFEIQFESGSASIWKSSRRLNGVLYCKELQPQ